MAAKRARAAETKGIEKGSLKAAAKATKAVVKAVKAAAKAAPKAVAKAAKAMAKAAPKAAAKVAPKATAKVAPKATAKAIPKATAKAIPKAAAKAIPKAAAKAAPVAKPTAKAAPKAAAAPAPKAASNKGKPAPKETASAKAAPKAAPKKATPKAAPKADGAKAGGSGGLRAGDAVPSLELTDHDGNSFSLGDLRGESYLIYFYPKNDTPGCTREACAFRDDLGKYDHAKVRVIGVSPDKPESHTRFRTKYGLPFTLLSDVDKTAANAFGVWVKKQNYGREYMGIERSTFLVDESGKVKKVWRNVKVDGHSQAVLAEAQ
jgi:peroxiredoxin Q/BCP